MARIPKAQELLVGMAALPASVMGNALLRLTRPGSGPRLYGLADTAPAGGPLSVDSFSADGLRTLTAVALAYGDSVDVTGPLVVVHTELRPERRPDAEAVVRMTAATLARRDQLLAEGKYLELDDTDPQEVLDHGQWSEAGVEVVVDGGAPRHEAVSVVHPRGDEADRTGFWAFSTPAEQARVIVAGRHPCPEQVLLARVTDLEPYFSGNRSRALRLVKLAFS
ncbi:hypothetical protein [Catenulispora subtropica]|uniref:Uncharacterized protein n=1 Tax=Catenulispora subtropica TaxID=450798 RepID=A0ABN2QNJ2_9ACTN